MFRLTRADGSAHRHRAGHRSTQRALWGRRHGASTPGIRVVSGIATAAMLAAGFSTAGLITRPESAHAATSPTWQCGADGYVFQASAGASNVSVTKIDLTTGEATSVGKTPSNLVKSVGYNTLDDYIYSLDFQQGSLLRIGSDLSVEDLGPVPGASGTYNLGDFDRAGHFWLASSARPTAK